MPATVVMGDEMPKVMIFTPTWRRPDGELAMRPETRASIEAQTFDGEIVWEIGLENPFPYETHRNVLAQFQYGQQLFFESDCDAFMTVEHDMVIPPDATQKLWDVVHGGWNGQKVGAAYGVYLLRHGSLVLNAWEYIGERNLGESLSLMPEKLAAARKAGIVRVCGCGNGCTLFSREALTRFPFHRSENDDDQWCPDIPFAYDAIRNGMVCVARFDVPCDHLDGELRLKPFDSNASSGEVSARANASMNIAIIARTMKIHAGTVYKLPRETARELQRAGYVTILPDELPDAPEPEQADMPALEKAVKKRVKLTNGI